MRSRMTDLSSLHDLLLHRRSVCRISGNDSFDRSSLDSDCTDRDSSETSTTDDLQLERSVGSEREQQSTYDRLSPT